jgi:predicted metal-dependent hydrolase
MKDNSPIKEVAVRFMVSRRAKRISIRVLPGGKVITTRPVWATEAAVLRFLASKREWIARAVGKMSKKKVLAGSAAMGFKNNQRTAKAFVEEKVAKLNQVYGFMIGKIRVKDQASRWGSCSAKGNLNFNYRIVSLPDDLAEYVVVHELCHIKELNHSRAFWDLVALTVPDHRARRKELRNIIFG